MDVRLCCRVVTLFTTHYMQGECCSSYAFSIVAALEGSHALATGELVSLSEQNVVDCSGMNYHPRCWYQLVSFPYLIPHSISHLAGCLIMATVHNNYSLVFKAIHFNARSR